MDRRDAARSLLAVAVDVAARGSVSEARAIASATAALSDDAEAHALAARLAHAQADFGAARESFAAAVAIDRRGGDERSALRKEIASAFTVYDEGDGALAGAILDDIEARAVRVGLGPELAPYLLGYRGNLARQRGDHAQGRVLYASAVTAAGNNGDDAFARVFAMDDAIAALLMGDVDDAARCLALLHAELAVLPIDLWLAFTKSLVEHYQALAALLAGDAAASSRLTDGLPSLQPVRDAVAEGVRTGAVLRQLQHFDARTEHARISARLLARVTTFKGAPRVVVARDGGRFVHGDRVVDLRARRPLRRILARLAAGHAEGGPVPIDVLIEAGWPGEHLLASAARNRFHVALSTLRKLGLEGAIEHDVDGYRLDRRSVVVET